MGKRQDANDIEKLRWHAVLAQVVSVAILLFGVVALISYFDPALVGTPPEQFRHYKGRLPWFLSGLLFVGLGILFFYVSTRRTRRAVWVFSNHAPIAMCATLDMVESSDSTTFYVSLRDTDSVKPRWRVWVHPTFEAGPLVGVEHPAEVYIDPKYDTPAAVKIAAGVLWANPYAK